MVQRWSMKQFVLNEILVSSFKVKSPAVPKCFHYFTRASARTGINNVRKVAIGFFINFSIIIASNPNGNT